jgi:hypothetical protein
MEVEGFDDFVGGFAFEGCAEGFGGWVILGLCDSSLVILHELRDFGHVVVGDLFGLLLEINIAWSYDASALPKRLTTRSNLYSDHPCSVTRNGFF